MEREPGPYEGSLEDTEHLRELVKRVGPELQRIFEEVRSISGRYSDERILGSGGMGEVLSVYDQTLRRRVAIKRLRLERMEPDLLERFLAEAQITAQLDHPNIPPVYEAACDESGDAYYAMKEVRGRTLAELITSAEVGFRELLRAVVKICDAIGYLERAVVLAKRGDLGGAIADCERAMEIAPAFPRAYEVRGKVRVLKGDLLGAIADFDRMIEIDPRHASGYRLRAQVWHAKGDMERAIADYTQAIEFGPENARSFYGRGLSRSKKGDLEGALADYGRAIEINPRYPEAYANRGDVLTRQEDLRGALSHYQKALDVAPADWEYRGSVETRFEDLRKVLDQR